MLFRSKTFRAEAKLDYTYLVPPTINDDAVTEIARNAAVKVLSPDAPISCPKTMGGEDFSFFLEKVPGAIALLGVGNEACGAIWAQHSGKYRVDESALLGGVMFYVQTAMDFNAQ